MAEIWIFAENREHTLELLNVGRVVAEQLGAKILTFAQSNQLAQEYINHGSDEILLLPALAEDQPLESYVPVITEEARRENPDVFLVGGTQRGKEIAARIAARLNTGLCSGCTGLRLDGEKKLLVMERMLFGGAAVQTVVCTTRPQMATIPPRAFEPAALVEGKEGKVRELPAVPSTPVTVVKRTPKVRESVDITEAKIIVCVGRGVEKKEDIALAR